MLYLTAAPFRSLMIYRPLSSLHLAPPLFSLLPLTFSPLFFSFLSSTSPSLSLSLSVSLCLSLSLPGRCCGCQLSLAGQTSRDAVLYAARHTGSSRSSVRACMCVCVLSFIFFFPSSVLSLHPSVMSAVLQTPPHSRRSELCCTDNPPVGAFRVRVFGRGVPLFVGVCVFKEKKCVKPVCLRS